jgi:hypothetical protein
MNKDLNKQKIESNRNDMIKKVQKKKQKENVAAEVSMVESVHAMERKLLAIQSSDGNKVKFLEMQVKSRIEGTTKFVYTGFDPKFFKKGGHIRMSPAGKSGVTQQLAYLKELLTLMIEYDIKHNHYSSPSSDTSGPSLSLYRTLPEPNPELCSSASLAYEKVGREAASKMDIEEDEEFNQFDKYVGKLFYDRDESKFFKVMAIEYDEKFGFLASSVNCDVHGDVLAECMTPFGDVIDKHIWPYTLEGNAEGDTMDDLIRAYEEKAKQLSESQTQKKKSKRTRH